MLIRRHCVFSRQFWKSKYKPINSKMNAMPTLHQLVASVNYEGLHRLWGAVTQRALSASPRKY